MTKETKRIDAYSLVELLEQVQENIQLGYLIDLSTNENYPQIIGHHYTLGMVYSKSTVVINNSTEEISDSTEVKSKPGRKPKEV